jgi:hypothetical protein
VNNTPGKNLPNPPYTQVGNPIDCHDLAASMATGLNLVGPAMFLDTVIGDLWSWFGFVCE